MLAARLLHKQLLTGGLVLVQHALPSVDHPAGGGRETGEAGARASGLTPRHEKSAETLKNAEG